MASPGAEEWEGCRPKAQPSKSQASGKGGSKGVIIVRQPIFQTPAGVLGWAWEQDWMMDSAAARQSGQINGKPAGKKWERQQAWFMELDEG